MSQRSQEPATRRTSPLDRAVVFSVVAMAMMNVIVLAQQLTVPQFAASTFAGLGLA